ncbi:hypothetical protein FISHEDRAFT_40318 [Fistulina hepatica ATCC 64428]|uniref:Protein YAE1 n=1 Tax=Fistulina hepatica ATCC 64428 TaxID=1128425 RepID=A0A0D7AF23_9AGAR|nr:hypothetical protein FISHEDRAFT_40318 [Fistulina hepatica ATCC 64428]
MIFQRPDIVEIGTESPWDESADPATVKNIEWSRMSSDFTNAGYREGITAGKEAALQEGFDAGFASVGVPLGRELGQLRGQTSALLSLLALESTNPARGPNMDVHNRLLSEAREISQELSNVRFSDIAPPDAEAEEHARLHLPEMDTDASVHREFDGIADESSLGKHRLEALENQLSQMTAGSSSTSTRPRLSYSDVQLLKSRIEMLASEVLQSG